MMKKQKRPKLVRLSDEIIDQFIALPEELQDRAIEHFKGGYPRITRVLRTLKRGTIWQGVIW